MYISPNTRIILEDKLITKEMAIDESIIVLRKGKKKWIIPKWQLQ